MGISSNFNPATVWFELFLSAARRLFFMRHFNPATVWFEHIKRRRSNPPNVLFQSRNGLIWTSLVWTLRTRPRSFQSRNGLIWTPFMFILLIIMLVFQSRNGLIWTGRPKAVENEIDVISIPQRSDLNHSYRCCFRHVRTISIPQRSDLNSKMEWVQERSRRNFNPATVWFEPWPVWRRVHNVIISIPQRSDLNDTEKRTRTKDC